MRAFDAVEIEKGELSRLDGAIGDADRGVTMAMGFEIVSRTLMVDSPDDPAGAFDAAARAFLDAVGASTGPIYATASMRAGAAVRGRASLGRDDVVRALAASAEAIADRGNAKPGEKTMLDAWAPAAEAAEHAASEGRDLRACLDAAVAAAEAGAEATKAMPATKGRAPRRR